MKYQLAIYLVLSAIGCSGCASSRPLLKDNHPQDASVQSNPLHEKEFVFEVLRYVYRWHFDQSFLLEADKTEMLHVWSRRLHANLDSDDRSEYAELWIPAVNMVVELKRADYEVPELKLQISESAFKVTRVNRQKQPPASSRQYQVHTYPLSEVRDHLFATRASRETISDSLRTAARQLVVDYLSKTYPQLPNQDQVFYISPLTRVCNELWVFWETGRKLLFFSADMDLTNPAFSQLSQLRMQVIDLDNDVVASTREVPGSNAYVTKDWVGRLFYNCIMFGEKVVRTPEQIRHMQ